MAVAISAMTDDQILDEFRAADALLEGHFILSSGLRSPRYLQCARVLMDGDRAERLARALAAKLPAGIRENIDAVVSPAMGGVIIGHEMGRALGRPAMFLERPDGEFQLRRGFAVEPRSDRGSAQGGRRGRGRSSPGRPLGRQGRPWRVILPADPDRRADLYGGRAPARPRRDSRGQTGKPRGRLTDRLRLGVNIDHVATIRNARGGAHPDPVQAALIAARAGADGITAHLREDRRHITDRDIDRLMAEIDLPLNLEMAATEEMLAIALRHKPHAACIVPERREERTTEGGLDAAGQLESLGYYVDQLGRAGIRISLFIEPNERQVDAAIRLAAPVVEFHTGRYAHASDTEAELKKIADCAALAAKNGIEAHAGHGLTFDNVVPVAAIPQIAELNIGHFLVGEAIFTGLDASVRRMRELMDSAR